MTNRYTRKKNRESLNHISGRIHSRKDGWIIASIHGNARERGFAHGALLHEELVWVLHCLPFLIETELHTTPDEFIFRCKKLFHDTIKNKYPEYFEELVGICLGAKSKGVDITIDVLIAWNSFLSMYEEYLSSIHPHSHTSLPSVASPKNVERCSAFIATGNATENGDIIMAHNTHCSFVVASMSNIVLYVYPVKGFAFCMQTSPGMISSTMDWFLCSNGMIGCETTISGVKYKPQFGIPYYCRIRDCMQYRNSLDEYANTMLSGNAGDYACSWLFGDTRSGEIMLCEIGLKTHNIRKTRDGVFYGMNSAIDPVVRLMETDDTTFEDISKSSGARHVRLEYLLNDKYAGKINVRNAKRILADHYDVLLDRPHRGIRSICKHLETSAETQLSTKKESVVQSPQHFENFRRNDRRKTHRKTPSRIPVISPESLKSLPRPAFLPYGTIDGKVVNTEMAQRMMFSGKFGASCNRAFYVKPYLEKHPEYRKYREYLVDLPNQKWTTISEFTGEATEGRLV